MKVLNSFVLGICLILIACNSEEKETLLLSAEKITVGVFKAGGLDILQGEPPYSLTVTDSSIANATIWYPSANPGQDTIRLILKPTQPGEIGSLPVDPGTGEMMKSDTIVLVSPLNQAQTSLLIVRGWKIGNTSLIITDTNKAQKKITIKVVAPTNPNIPENPFGDRWKTNTNYYP